MPYCGKLEFYYGNMSEFWRFLDIIYPDNNLYRNGCPKLEDINKFLAHNKFSITDIVMHTHVDRFSTDKDMGAISNEDLNTCLKKWLKESQIETIYFTSFGGTNSARSLFKKWYKKEFGKVRKISKEHKCSIVMFERNINLIDLFSPSPTARKNASRIKEFIGWREKTKTKNDYDTFRIEWYREHLPKL